MTHSEYVVEPITVVDTTPLIAVQYPEGGQSQYEFAKWFEENVPDRELELIDGHVKTYDEPLADGSFWQWTTAWIRAEKSAGGNTRYHTAAHAKSNTWLIIRKRDDGTHDVRMVYPEQMGTTYSTLTQ